MKYLLAFFLVAAAIGVGSYAFFRDGAPSSASADGSNVQLVNGTQVVEIRVRGGYQPQTSAVKPGIPTIIRFKTNGTYDCSSTIRIPSLGVSQTLPATGATDVTVGTLAPGGVLQGTCGMGMYRFSLTAAGA